MASNTAPLSTPSRWISSTTTSATSLTYWRISQLRVMPSHFSGVVITILAVLKLRISGEWSPVSSTTLKKIGTEQNYATLQIMKLRTERLWLAHISNLCCPEKPNGEIRRPQVLKLIYSRTKYGKWIRKCEPNIQPPKFFTPIWNALAHQSFQRCNVDTLQNCNPYLSREGKKLNV